MGKLQIWTAVLRGGEYMEPVGFSEENEQERAAGENEHEEEMTGSWADADKKQAAGRGNGVRRPVSPSSKHSLHDTVQCQHSEPTAATMTPVRNACN